MRLRRRRKMSPLFELKCLWCDTVFEVLVASREELDKCWFDCPNCSSTDSELLPSKVSDAVIK